MLQKARNYAIKAHQAQKYGDKPYIYHLDSVVKYLTKYTREAQVVGYLHDIVEDTDRTLEDVKEEFSEEIGEYIRLITDESGKNRDEIKRRTNEKLSLIPADAKQSIVLIVKTADRLTNIENSFANNQELFQMYVKEHSQFKKSVYRKGLCDELWDKIDRIIRMNSQLQIVNREEPP